MSTWKPVRLPTWEEGIVRVLQSASRGALSWTTVDGGDAVFDSEGDIVIGGGGADEVGDAIREGLLDAHSLRPTDAGVVWLADATARGVVAR